jgi:dTDP-4-dehydrorhamnose 3,5-epimerase
MIDAKDGMPPLKLIVESSDYSIYGTKIEGLLVFERRLFPDSRGFYQELSRIDPIADVLGRPVNIKQSSLSYNYPGVLRGLHAEPMDKIITPLTGKIFIAIADIRPDSSTFSKYETFTLDQTNPLTPRRTIVLSNGLANSFLTLGDENVEYIYMVSDTYSTSEEKRAVRWNDPDINIFWPEEPKLISEDDKSKHPFLREMFPETFK